MQQSLYINFVPATLLDLLFLIMNEVFFLVISLGLSVYSILSSANSNGFTFSHLIWMPFIFFCLIAVARTFSTVVNKSGESGHPCLILDFRGKTFRFSLLSMMLAVGLSYTAFIMLRYVPSILTLLKF